MSHHIPTLALVASLALVLIALVVLVASGKEQMDGPVATGLVAAAGTAVGIIGGFSQQGRPPNPTTPPKA